MLPSGSSSKHEHPDRSQNILKPYSKAAAKEARRSRGEIACAECRRLKVRCNRQIPCATCVARGCAALCPNGTLPPGDNSRFVSQATDHLQRRITKMAERMRALEDALAIAQAAESSQPHSLLAVEPEDVEIDVSMTFDEGETSSAESITESFGTLHIDEKERTVRYFGTSGGSESLLINNSSAPSSPVPGLHQDVGPIDLRALGLPKEIDSFFYAFPLAPMATPTTPMRQIIESYLPTWDRAESLGRTMLDSMSWMISVVSLRQFTHELMPYVYFNKGGTGNAPDRSPYRGPHGLALFLSVLAIGSLADPSLPPYNADAQRYYVLAVVALGLDPILERHSLSTVKTLHLLSIYSGMSGTEANMANSYALLNLACKVAQWIGLHVDPTHWDMRDEDVYDRRCCYWGLLQGDLWQSIYSGRPSALVTNLGDCKIPSDDDEDRFQQGEYTAGFGIWGFQYSQECLVPALKLLVAPKQPTYESVLELDKKIRSLHPDGDEMFMDSPSHGMFMRWFVRSHYRELIILTLHRSFFAQALALKPTDPLDTPYKYSFRSAYEAACAILRSTSHAFKRKPEILSRVWMTWTFAFSSAVIVGAVASRCENLDIQPSPIRSLQSACSLFEQASKTNSRAAAALPVLLNMREKAMHLHRDPSTLTIPSAHLARRSSWSADEVDILRGKPRLVESPSNSAEATPELLPPSVPPFSRRSSEPVMLPAPALSLPPPSGSPHLFPPTISYPPGTSRAPWGDVRHAPQERLLPPQPSSYPPQSFHEAQRPPIPIPPPAAEQAWRALPGAPGTYYDYSSSSLGPSPASVDFNLEESWTSFWHQYGRLP
ncbi:hypothetical protein BC629DRAFT_1690247 [Irpex lacteus]|nr:hypothetical protein BC629DRAFT_1690247 [Irpex lacteus]